MARTFPYGTFNYLVNLNSPGVNPQSPSGGFSEVSGLNTEVVVAEYRNGNDPENHVRKIVGMNKSGDVTCKRGVVNSKDLWEWINQTRKNGSNARRQVVITLMDEAANPVQKWILRGVIPLKYTGPTLQGKGGTDVAMEELVLSVEKIDFELA
jgi:phage tail-like protein